MTLVALTQLDSADHLGGLRPVLNRLGATVTSGVELAGASLPEARGFTAVVAELRHRRDAHFLQYELRKWAEHEPPLPGYDLNILDADQRTPEDRMLILDVDSTLIEQEVIDELAARAGKRQEVAEVTARAMAGELDFAGSLRERVAALEGLEESVLAEVASELTLTPGAEQLIRAFRTQGFPIGLVSGGFEQVLTRLAGPLDVDHQRANRLEIVDGRLTGRVFGDVVDGEAKAAALKEWAGEHDLKPKNVVAVGDGANDIPMIREAGLGIAFAAKPALTAEADAQISFRRLDAVRAVAGI